MYATRNNLETRITRLERGNSAYRTLVLLGVFAGLMAMTPDDGSIQARSVELVAGDGSVRAALRLEDGNPVLTLGDENDVDRLKIFHTADATGLYVMDADSTTRIGKVTTHVPPSQK